MEESEARMERMMDVKILAVHKRLNAFELRVLERPVPTVDINTFQTELARLCYDVDALLAPTEAVPKTAPVEEVDEVVLSSLFGDEIPVPYPSRAAGKRSLSSDQSFDPDETR